MPRSNCIVPAKQEQCSWPARSAAFRPQQRPLTTRYRLRTAVVASHLFGGLEPPAEIPRAVLVSTSLRPEGRAPAASLRVSARHIPQPLPGCAETGAVRHLGTPACTSAIACPLEPPYKTAALVPLGGWHVSRFTERAGCWRVQVSAVSVGHTNKQLNES